ncbi:MAG: cyanophycinase [Anaerolineae bacterium]
MSKKHNKNLILIGGHEDKEDECVILKEVVKAAVGGELVIITVATDEPDAMAQKYEIVFHELGVDKVHSLDVRLREDAQKEENVELIERASVIFFTGGDQLRITSQIGDTPVFRTIRERHEAGMTIAGTSAGAAAMPETMVISGAGDETSEISAIGMAPGLGFVHSVVIDSHFAERGRISRLLGVVAQNPANLGLGIDENTAIVIDEKQCFKVIGGGAVYVLDGTDLSYSSLSEEHPEGVMTIHDLKLHVLGADDIFDLVKRRPVLQPESASH